MLFHFHGWVYFLVISMKTRLSFFKDFSTYVSSFRFMPLFLQLFGLSETSTLNSKLYAVGSVFDLSGNFEANFLIKLFFYCGRRINDFPLIHLLKIILVPQNLVGDQKSSPKSMS